MEGLAATEEDKQVVLDLLPNTNKNSSEDLEQTSSYLRLGEQKECRVNRYVTLCALFASLNSVLLGYDIGIMSGAVLFIRENLKIHELQEEVLMGSLNLVAIAGGIMAGRLADAIGRKLTMAIASLIFLMGAATMGAASTFGFLMLGRLVSGVGVGFGLMIAPVYTAELAPSDSRGALVSFPEVFINTGILIGYIMSFLLSGLPATINWRLMLGAGCIPAILLVCGVMFMPESPRWLVLQRRTEEARQVLLKTSGNKAEAELRLADIVAAVTSTQQPQGSKGEGIWRELLCPVSSVRRMLVIVLGVQFFQQASGIDALIYYSPAVFNEAGITSKPGLLGMTVAIGFAKTLSVLVATSWLDKTGRRPLLLISGTGMTIFLAAVSAGLIFLNTEPGTGSSLHHHLPVVNHNAPEASSSAAVALTLLAICLFMIFFSIGFGPVCWVLTSEVFPLRLRAQATSLAILVSRLVSGVVTLTFLSVSRAITVAGTFFIFCGIAAASVVFVWALVPETKGRTLEEVSRFFERDEDYRQPSVELAETHNVEQEEEQQHHDDPSPVAVYDSASLLAKVKLIAAKK